jgi:type II secretory pathway pseudopilin PulG
LIELLVVITIIAILATVATPMIGKARVSARMIPATKNVQSILTSMTLYSGDYGGLYPEAPEGEDSSNAALRQLFPDACDSEKIFYIQSDRVFCDPVNPPDEDYGEANGQMNGRALEAGENHWAYVAGLTDSNKGSTPVLADGFTDGIGRYNEHHVWSKPNKAIVGFLDGSASALKLREGEPIAPQGGNYFEIPDIADDEYVTVLNPIPRRGGQ